MRSAAPLALLCLVWPAAAQEPPVPFELPVICDMETVCSVQVYVDQDPSDGVVDHACGHLSYDGHTGTDIRVRNLADMNDGVAVVAAAPGTVVGVRDGMDDVYVSEIGLQALEGQFAGNGVGIRHEGGWFTQYSHLRKGSIMVEVGDTVEAGTPLGLIGLSGRTSFPHLEFVVRYRDETVDPFAGFVEGFSCTGPRRPLWSDAALAAMPYRPAWLLNAGFADEAVKGDKIRSGDYDLDTLPDGAAVLSFWVNYANAFGGDRYEMSIDAPDGSVLALSRQKVDKPQYTFYAFTGLRRPGDGWQSGTYRGRFALFRGGRQILTAERDLTVP